MANEENLMIPEGYTIGPVSENYGTFEVFQGNKKIGRIGWHGDYYTKFHSGESEFSVTGYINGENPQQKGLNALVSFHKVVGDLQLEYGVSFAPNVFMNTFTMTSSFITHPVIERIHYANVHHKADGWHVEQLYGELATTMYPSAQEAAQAATEAANVKGKTVRYIAQEMVKAGWAKDEAHADTLVGYGWGSHKVQINDELPIGIVHRKVKPGDVITWNYKTWTVK